MVLELFTQTESFIYIYNKELKIKVEISIIDMCANGQGICQSNKSLRAGGNVIILIYDLFHSSGVKIFEKVAVETILTDGKSITAVETTNGTIKCEILVNCGGQVCFYKYFCNLCLLLYQRLNFSVQLDNIVAQCCDIDWQFT